MLKLGTDHLPPGFDGPVDRKVAAAPHVALVRLRMQQVARLLADALLAPLRDAPEAPLDLVNIAGGPALDSINALIMLAREHAPLMRRPLAVHVLDTQPDGPAFGARALTALAAPGGPLDRLEVKFQHNAYDWNDTAPLARLLDGLAARGAIIAASSEGGLFEYGSDDAVVANLTELARVRVPIVAGSVTSASAVRKRMIALTRYRFFARGLEGFTPLAERTGYADRREPQRPQRAGAAAVRAGSQLRGDTAAPRRASVLCEHCFHVAVGPQTQHGRRSRMSCRRWIVARQRPAHGVALFDVEAHGNDEGQRAVRGVAGRLRHRLGAGQHIEGFLVERGRARALHDRAAQQVALAIDGEGDRRDALLMMRTGRRRIALEALEMGGERALPPDHCGRRFHLGARRRRRRRGWRQLDGRHRGRLPLLDRRLRLGGSGSGSATSATSSGGLVSSLGGGVGSVSISGGPGARSLGGAVGAAVISGSSSMTTGAPASKSDDCGERTKLKAAMAWSPATTRKHDAHRAVSVRSNPKKLAEDARAAPRRLRCGAHGIHSAAGAAAG